MSKTDFHETEIRAAARLFNDYGYDGMLELVVITMRDVARREKSDNLRERARRLNKFRLGGL